MSWETESEVGAQGYHVLRSERAAGPFERVTDSMIPATSRLGQTGHYEYTDNTTRPGRLYYYRVHEVSETGSAREHPETVRAVAGSTMLDNIVPLLLRSLVPVGT